MNQMNKKYALLSKSEQDASQGVDQGKRTFVGGLVGASGLAVAPGVMLYQTASANQWNKLSVTQCVGACALM